MINYNNPRRLAVAREIRDVQRLLARTFDYNDETHLSVAIDEAIRETESAFFYAECDRAEHLVKVTEALIKREGPKFKANPKGMIELWREQHKTHHRKSFAREASL
jgi:hypothetical protein